MIKINYKSDFDFILFLKTANGEKVGWPDYDFTVRIYTTLKVNAFVARCIGGVCENCFNDNGQIHIVADSHHLSPGRLKVEFIAELPNGMYPDGDERQVVPETLDIELVRGGSPVPDAMEIEMMLPYILADIPQYGNIVFETDEAEYTMPICRQPAQRTVKSYYYYYADGGGIGEWDI